MSVQEITQAALDLPTDARESLGYTLLRSVGVDRTWDETDLSDELLERRLREMKEDHVKVVGIRGGFPGTER